MPIYMDRHDVSDDITDEDVVNIHQQDLKVQDKFNCRVLSYYFDKKRNQAFCLVEAPDKASMVDMHEHSHGQVPNKVIEVNEADLTSYLGGIEKPHLEKDTGLYINRVSPNRIIMFFRLVRTRFDRMSPGTFHERNSIYLRSVLKIIDQYAGSIVNQKVDHFILSFRSAFQAISCALAVQDEFNNCFDDPGPDVVKLNIGIASGVPVTEKDALFESATRMAGHLCTVVKGPVVLSFGVKNLLKDEKLGAFEKWDKVHVLNPSDENFLTLLMDHLDASWNDPDLKVDNFGVHLGLSKSQLYRKTVSLTGKSPLALIRDYRLERALSMLNKFEQNVTEIAFETGFNSPAYFSKCFQQKYGILPTNYLKLHVSPS